MKRLKGLSTKGEVSEGLKYRHTGNLLTKYRHTVQK